MMIKYWQHAFDLCCLLKYVNFISKSPVGSGFYFCEAFDRGMRSFAIKSEPHFAVPTAT